jgi:hypothetical protein
LLCAVCHTRLSYMDQGLSRNEPLCAQKQRCTRPARLCNEINDLFEIWRCAAGTKNPPRNWIHGGLGENSTQVRRLMARVRQSRSWSSCSRAASRSARRSWTSPSIRIGTGGAGSSSGAQDMTRQGVLEVAPANSSVLAEIVAINTRPALLRLPPDRAQWHRPAPYGLRDGRRGARPAAPAPA